MFTRTFGLAPTLARSGCSPSAFPYFPFPLLLLLLFLLILRVFQRKCVGVRVVSAARAGPQFCVTWVGRPAGDLCRRVAWLAQFDWC